MVILDPRSGREIKVGETIEYGEDEWLRLDRVDDAFFAPKALVTHTYHRYQPHVPMAFWPLVTHTKLVPLSVRWLHPDYVLRRVGILPT